MKTVTVKCAFCENPIEKLQKEVNRSLKHNRKMFCNHSCSCSYGLKINPRKGNPQLLKANNRLDKFSPFRYYVNKAKSKQRIDSYGVTNLSVEYLNNLWESQKGICPYTKKFMFLPPNTKTHNYKAVPNQASLDRINSSLGYIEGNVEFVCYAVNLAKNSFGREEMIEFFLNKSL